MANFYLPGEWEHQYAIELIWPHQNSAWRSNLGSVILYYLNLTRIISQHQNVIIIAQDNSSREDILQLLALFNIASSKINIYIAPSNDTWARDVGPITILNKSSINNNKIDNKILLDFEFNGWGGKYEFKNDNGINKAVFKNLTPINFILEGGSIDSNGHRTILTTESCLLNANRNKNYNKPQIENLLNKYLHIDKIIWIKNSCLTGDDTDGHIDMLARFCNKNTIAYTQCINKDDPNYYYINKLEQELQALAKINNYNLIPLPLPQPIFDNKQQLPASYANFLIINQAVLVPVYHDKHDIIALDNLKLAFPNREIIPILSLEIIKQFGSLHCLTMNLY